MESLGAMYAVMVIFLFILAVLWFFLPFAVFGTKGKIEELRSELKRSNDLLKAIHESLKQQDPRILFCPKCRQAVSPDAKVCPKCNTDVSQ